MTKKSNCVIIDANAFVHKAYHGYNEMLDKDLNDNRVLYGIMHVIQDLPNYIDNIEYLFVIFDPVDSLNYRKSIYPAYKENRAETIPQLDKQRDVAKKEIKNLGIPIINFQGYEADDIIASVANFYKKTNSVVIVSPDKDLFQMVGNNIEVLRPYKKAGEKGYEIITEIGVEKYFGVKPSQIPDLLALMGDVTDNLPGVDKMGLKTSAKMLNKYNSIENMILMKDELPEKIKMSFIDSIHTLPKIKHLATVIGDLKVESYIEACLEHAINTQNHIGYNQKLIEYQKFYNWPDHFIALLKHDNLLNSPQKNKF